LLEFGFILFNNNNAMNDIIRCSTIWTNIIASSELFSKNKNAGYPGVRISDISKIAGGLIK
jgi:hypothetical protein